MLQPASAVALGLFDGVHIGHRAVLAAAVACQADGLTPAAFTMQTTSVRIKRGEPLRYQTAAFNGCWDSDRCQPTVSGDCSDGR